MEAIRKQTNQQSSTQWCFILLWAFHLPFGVLERVARFHAFLVLRQAKVVPVASLGLAAAEGVVGCGHMENVVVAVLIGDVDVHVGGWGRRSDGHG